MISFQSILFLKLANNLAIQLPIIVIASFALGAEAGYLMLAMKVMGIPVALIGGAVSQVYLAHAADECSNGNLKKYTIQTIISISKITIIPFLCIGALSPFLFPLVFGKEWSMAGSMVLWMLPWFFMQVISSPVSMSLHVVGKQKTALVLQIFGLLLRAGGVIIITYFFRSYIFEYYAVSGFVFYSLYLLVVLSSLKDKVEFLEDK